jgi:hypothetical protein
LSTLEIVSGIFKQGFCGNIKDDDRLLSTKRGAKSFWRLRTLKDNSLTPKGQCPAQKDTA